MITIAVDFDGTIVDHDVMVHIEPHIGKPVPHAITFLKEFQKHRAKIILWTMRSEIMNGQNHIDIAVNYLLENGINLYGINLNPDQHWTISPKAHADVYIDDRSVGCPLIHYEGYTNPCVDWRIVGPRVMDIIRRKK